MAIKIPKGKDTKKTKAEDNNTTEDILYKSVNDYVDAKQKMKPLEALTKKLSEFIKTELEKRELDGLDTGEASIVLSTQTTTKCNEDVLLDLIKKLGIKELIKTKEYVDLDLLEKFIYEEKLSTSDIKDAYTTSYTKKLLIK